MSTTDLLLKKKKTIIKAKRYAQLFQYNDDVIFLCTIYVKYQQTTLLALESVLCKPISFDL